MLHITEIEKNSIGEELGLCAGDIITAFNGVPVRDILDYHFYDGEECFLLTVESVDGTITEYQIEKYAEETLGLIFSDELDTRSCCNKCIFCFVDQLPEGMRETLYVKDDDWRHSFVSGNYVTLTNLKDGELERIIEQRYSPVYISVHTTDAELRKYMLGRKKDSDIMPVIKKLYGGGIEIHAQSVVCPGINDGAVLSRTIDDLAPYINSLAVVPVGLTKYYNTQIMPFNAHTAALTLDIVDKAQKKCLNKYGSRKIFAADELYLKAGHKFPGFEEYEDFPQIENGVGMCVKFLTEVKEAVLEIKRKPKYKSICFATGTAAFSLMQSVAEIIKSAYGLSIEVIAIENNFFGPTVNVAGLITGADLVNGLKNRFSSGCVMITKNMLKENGNVFLDGMTLKQAESEINTKIIPVFPDGYALINAVLGEKEN